MNTTVVILAAGMGTRIGSLTKKIPKCLIPFGNSTLLENSIAKLQQLKLKYIVVAGYLYEMVKKISNNVVVNEFYATTQTPYSLRIGLNTLRSGPVLVLDADIVFEKKLITDILEYGDKSLIVTYPALSKLEAGSRVQIEKGVITQIGRYISPSFPWQIHSGITKISAKDFNYYEELANRDTFRNTEMHVLLDEFCKNRTLYAFSVERPIIEKKTGDLSLAGGSLSDIVAIKQHDNVIKKRSQKGAPRLINEISYLCNLPDKLKLYFPELIEYKIDSRPVWYTMRHYEEPSLKKLILSGQFSALDTMDVLTRVVRFLMENVYVLKRCETPASYIYSVHFHRMYERKKQTILKVPLFKDIFKADKIIINGLEYENIITVIEKIKNCIKLIAVLQPPYLSMIHGDLHFDNILINTNNTPPSFRFVDPKGFSVGDPIYDIAKLFHDFHGLYDFIYEYMFDLKWSVKGNVIDSQFSIRNCAALKEFNKINEYFPPVANQFFRSDPNWYLRMKFTEAMHFSSLQPFHIQCDGIESKAIAMYLVGVRLINDFWHMIPSELKKKSREYKIANINTLEDFTNAQNLFDREPDESPPV